MIYTPCEIKLRKARSFDISKSLFDLKKTSHDKKNGNDKVRPFDLMTLMSFD